LSFLTCIIQGIIIDTCKELEITVSACGRQVDIEYKNTSENFNFLEIYLFELTGNSLSAKWLYS